MDWAAVNLSGSVKTFGSVVNLVNGGSHVATAPTGSMCYQKCWNILFATALIRMWGLDIIMIFLDHNAFISNFHVKFSN